MTAERRERLIKLAARARSNICTGARAEKRPGNTSYPSQSISAKGMPARKNEHYNIFANSNHAIWLILRDAREILEKNSPVRYINHEKSINLEITLAYTLPFIAYT